MMEKLKYPKITLLFETQYKTSNIKIKFQNQYINLPCGSFYLDYQIKSIDDELDIDFFNFVPGELQKVLVTVLHEQEKKDTKCLSIFEMKDNLYVENKILKTYNDIHFNGKLRIKFFKQWFECNILDGAHIINGKNLPVQWVDNYSTNSLRIDNTKKIYDIICIGCSLTYGIGLTPEDSWPNILQDKTGLTVGNFGIPGAGIDSCLKQVYYVKRNYKVKEIYILLPPFVRKRIKFLFGDYITEYLFCLNCIYPKILSKTTIENVQRKIEKSSYIDGKKYIKILESFPNVKLTSWDNDVYNSITKNKKLPKYTDRDRYPERAEDGWHTHRKHNEYFVELILKDRQKNNQML